MNSSSAVFRPPVVHSVKRADGPLIGPHQSHLGGEAEADNVVRHFLVGTGRPRGRRLPGRSAQAAPEAPDAGEIIETGFRGPRRHAGEIVIGVDDVPLRKGQETVALEPGIAWSVMAKSELTAGVGWWETQDFSTPTTVAAMPTQPITASAPAAYSVLRQKLMPPRGPFATATSRRRCQSRPGRDGARWKGSSRSSTRCGCRR